MTAQYLRLNQLKNNTPVLSLKTKYASGADPDIFGPPLWFSLHNSAAHYPNNPSKEMQQQMIYLIISIPILVPCAMCKNHVSHYISQNSLETVVKNKSNLFEFFCNMHNSVRQRQGKDLFTLDEAKAMYNYDGNFDHMIVIKY